MRNLTCVTSDLSRREFFRAVGRTGAAAALGAMIAGACRTDRSSADAAVCLANGVCPGCRLLADCPLPPATVYRREER